MLVSQGNDLRSDLLGHLLNLAEAQEYALSSPCALWCVPDANGVFYLSSLSPDYPPLAERPNLDRTLRE